MTSLDKRLEELRNALKRDWRTLYVKEFTTNWREQRLIRETEIDVMSLENLLALIKEECRKETESLRIRYAAEMSNLDQEIMSLKARIKELSEEVDNE